MTGRGATRNKLHETDYAPAEPYGGDYRSIVVYDNKAADKLARAKCWHRAGENGIIYPRPKGSR